MNAEVMSLADEFQSHIVNWRARVQEDEWYFVRLREKLTADLQPHEAFDAISQVVELTLQQTDEALCLECFELLFALSRVANTTQVNPTLSDKWEPLCEHVSQFGDYHRQRVGELRRWYRRDASS